MRIVRRVLDPGTVNRFREELVHARWADGRATAGHQSSLAKDNAQVAVDCPVGQRLGEEILGALGRHADFVAAALPLKVFPPLFNRYAGGQSFGAHVDNAVRQVPGTPHRVRTDLSMTLFLSDPAEYDGGELVIAADGGRHVVKLEAGDAFLYVGSTLHEVTPVTRGERIASFFWIQSMVRDGGERALLLKLDEAVRTLPPESEAALSLVAVYHELLRRWADA